MSASNKTETIQIRSLLLLSLLSMGASIVAIVVAIGARSSVASTFAPTNQQAEALKAQLTETLASVDSRLHIARTELEMTRASVEAQVRSVAMQNAETMNSIREQLQMLSADPEANLAFELRPAFSLECGFAANVTDVDQAFKLYLEEVRTRLQSHGLDAEDFPDANGRVAISVAMPNASDRRRAEMRGWIARRGGVGCSSKPATVVFKLDFVTLDRASYRDASAVKEAASKAFDAVLSAAWACESSTGVVVNYPSRPKSDKE